MKKILYISIFLFALNAKSQTYIPEGRDIKLISLEGCKKKIGGLPCDSCFIITGATGKLSRCYSLAEIRAMLDTTLNVKVTQILSFSGDTLYSNINGTTANVYLGSSGSCNCCDSLYYDRNDSLAHVDYWINKGDYYTLNLANDYGWKWGTLKQMIEDVGYLIESFTGLIIALDENVGFSGRAPRCKFSPPSNVLPEYRNDSLAKVGGLTRFVSFYRLTNTNDYGMQPGTIVKVSEP